VLVGAHGQQMPQASPPNSQGYQCSSGGPSPTLQPHPLAAAAAAAAAAAPGMLQQMGSGYGCGSPMLMSPAGGAQAPLSGAGSLELGGGLQQRYQPLQQQWSQPVVPTTQAAAGECRGNNSLGYSTSCVNCTRRHVSLMSTRASKG
jgi:hypothetical protein